MEVVSSRNSSQLQEFAKSHPEIDMQSISDRLKNSPMGTGATGGVTFKTVNTWKILIILFYINNILYSNELYYIKLIII